MVICPKQRINKNENNLTRKTPIKNQGNFVNYMTRYSLLRVQFAVKCTRCCFFEVLFLLRQSCFVGMKTNNAKKKKQQQQQCVTCFLLLLPKQPSSKRWISNVPPENVSWLLGGIWQTWMFPTLQFSGVGEESLNGLCESNRLPQTRGFDAEKRPLFCFSPKNMHCIFVFLLSSVSSYITSFLMLTTLNAQHNAKVFPNTVECSRLQFPVATSTDSHCITSFFYLRWRHQFQRPNQNSINWFTFPQWMNHVSWTNTKRRLFCCYSTLLIGVPPRSSTYNKPNFWNGLFQENSP